MARQVVPFFTCGQLPSVGDAPVKLQVQIPLQLMERLQARADGADCNLTDYVRSVLERHATDGGGSA